MLSRSFHTSTIRATIKPVFKPHNSRNGIKTFDGNFAPTEKKKEAKKIWEKLGISKDEFFGTKYANISAEERKKLDEKVARQRRYRELRKQHELGDDYKPKTEPVQMNPVLEYIYGTHPVLLALKSGKRRSFSRLFLFNKKEHTSEIVDAAKKYGTRIVEKYSKQELNKLSANGVHNGVVLETNPLKKFELFGVKNYDGEKGVYTAEFADDKNKKQGIEVPVARTPKNDSDQRFPFGIYLDGITDPMNIGNIIRSAYYMGVDFIVVSERDSGRLGPVAAKASAGALDLMTIYKAAPQLIDTLKKSGWSIVSTLAKPSDQELESMKEKHALHLNGRYIEGSDLPTLLSSSPMLMIMGSEGSGVQMNLKLKSDFLVGLDKGTNREDHGLIDSLNVSVATGLLIKQALD